MVLSYEKRHRGLIGSHGNQSGGGSAGVIFESGSQVDYANRTNTVITAPSGIQDGNTLLILFEIGAVAPPVPTPPAGFSILTGFPLTRTDGAFTVDTYAWVKIASGEGGSYTVTHAAANSTAYMLRVSGANTASPIDPNPTTNIGTGTTSTAPSITTTVNKSLIVFFVDGWDFVGGVVGPGGTTPTFTLRNTPANSLIFLMTGQLSPAGATGAKQATNVPAAGPWASGLIAIKAA